VLNLVDAELAHPSAGRVSPAAAATRRSARTTWPAAWSTRARWARSHTFRRARTSPFGRSGYRRPPRWPWRLLGRWSWCRLLLFAQMPRPSITSTSLAAGRFHFAAR
jgi:hypothetical protein